jgi:CO dehydrogenase maturation factor
MKIAVTGKGGVGKTTIVGLMARILRDQGQKVLAVDADPDMNLAAVLGVPDTVKITPIIEMKELIAERTGTEVGRSAPLFKLNPKVDDIPDTYCIEHRGIKLMVMGTVKKGGGGCACPENTFLKTLLSHLVIGRKEWVLLDMEAGIEHLGRGTAIGVDQMLVVVEPSQTSIATAQRIKQLSKDIGLTRVKVIGNKIQSPDERKFIEDHLGDLDIAGYIDYTDEIRKINTRSASAFDINGTAFEQMKTILGKLNENGPVPGNQRSV